MLTTSPTRSPSVRSGAQTISQAMVGAAVLGSLVVGSTAAFNPRLAAAFTIGVALVVAIARDVQLMLSALIVSLFIEIVSLGGIPISRVVAPVAMFVLLLAIVRGRLAIPRSAALTWVGALVLWAFASGLWSVNLGATMFLLGSLAIALIYMVAFAGLVESHRDLERVLLTIAVAAFATGVFAIMAFILGLSSELELGRTEGGTGDPNFFALYEIMALPLVLVLAGATQRRPLRLFLYATTAVIVGAVITSVSRGGLLTLAILLVLLLVLPSRTIFRSRRQKATTALLVIAGFVGALQFASTSVVPRVASVFSSGDSSQGLGSEGRGYGRLNIWLGASTAIKERPLLGLGYGAFQPSANDLMRRTPGVDLTTYDLHPEGQPAHSAFIETAAELGLPGLALFLGVLIATGVSLRRSAGRAREIEDPFLARVANALILSLIGWAVASLFLSSETSRAIWIVIGLTLALPRLVDASAAAGKAVRAME